MMKSKMQNLFLALAVMGAVQTVEAQINYAVSGDTAYVTNSYVAGNIVIASTYDGYPVTGIGETAFYYYCTNLTSVVALPLSNWTALTTNPFDGSGQLHFTNPISPAKPRQFYIFKMP